MGDETLRHVCPHLFNSTLNPGLKILNQASVILLQTEQDFQMIAFSQVNYFSFLSVSKVNYIFDLIYKK